MKQTLYQLFWRAFKSFFYKKTTMIDFVEDPYNGAEKIAKEILTQIEVAKYFGNVDLIFMGDSNCEFGNSFSEMIEWKKCGLTINIGKAGARFDQWYLILKSKTGQKVVEYINKNRIPLFVNLGGNHVLQKKMDTLETDIVSFVSLFSTSKMAAADLPDIMIPLLAPIYKMSKTELKNDVKKTNNLLKKYFNNYVPLGEFFMQMDEAKEDSGLLFELENDVLGDGLVHYSKKFNKEIRFPYYAKYSLEKIMGK